MSELPPAPDRIRIRQIAICAPDIRPVERAVEKDLDITPVLAELDSAPAAVMEGDSQLWYNVRQPPQIGLAAPVAALLEKLAA